MHLSGSIEGMKTRSSENLAATKRRGSKALSRNKFPMSLFNRQPKAHVFIAARTPSEAGEKEIGTN
jgi:hypothetical protein